jgi:hypothetical protein
MVAVVAAAACLVALAWFDATVLDDARKLVAASFQIGGFMNLTALGYVLVAGAILLVAALGWWSRSAVVGVVYAVAGAFLVLMPGLTFNRDLPESLGKLINEVWVVSTGPIFAVEMLGGGLLLVGLIVLGRSVVRRSRSTAVVEPPTTIGA